MAARCAGGNVPSAAWRSSASSSFVRRDVDVGTVERVGSTQATAPARRVERVIRDDAVAPRSERVGIRQGRQTAHDRRARFLRDVFGQGALAQDAGSNAVGLRPYRGDQLLQRGPPARRSSRFHQTGFEVQCHILQTRDAFEVLGIA